MNEHRVRRPDNQPPGRTDLQAQIHIVKGNGQADLVHSTHLLVQLGADHQAGGGDRAVVLIKMQAVKIAVGLHCIADKRVVCNATQPEYHACVLNSPVEEQQFGTHYPHFWPLGVMEQRTKPVAINDRWKHM